jgi:hypothetical protein
MNVFPYLANYSILYPGDGSLDKFIIRANLLLLFFYLSKQFPIAMSIVSPKILYLLLQYAIT